MVSSNSDLVIYNPTLNKVYIVTKATGNDIFIAFYGEKSEYSYGITSKIIKTIPPKSPTIIVTGSNVSDFIRDALMSNNPARMSNIAYIERITKKPRSGIISEAHLLRYKDGIMIDSKLISRDTYAPENGEIVRIVI